MNKFPNAMTSLAIIEYLASRFPQVNFTAPFMAYIQAQEGRNHRMVRTDGEEPLADFFRRLGVAEYRFASFLSGDSMLKHRINFADLLSRPSEDVYTYLLDTFSPLFELQQSALDAELPTGFNRHGPEHMRSVAQRAVYLLRERQPIQADMLRQENETIIGGFLHDIGNLIQRKYHGLYGIYLITRLFENVSADEATWQSFLNVLEIVLFHEVEFGSQLPELNMLQPGTLSVIVADKTDLSYKRVSSKSNVPEAIQDAHVLINLLIASASVERVDRMAGRFQWKLDFRAKFNESEQGVFSSLLKSTGRVKYPQEWRRLYEAGHIEYLFAFNSTFLSIYLSRLYFAMRATFALFPSVAQFELVIDDAERSVSLLRAFTRENYAENIRTLGRLFYRQDWEATYLYSALEAQREA